MKSRLNREDLTHIEEHHSVRSSPVPAATHSGGMEAEEGAAIEHRLLDISGFRYDGDVALAA